jgi:uncharacterized protein (DUF983 family)
MQAKYQVKQVIEALGSRVETLGLNTWQLRTLSAIKNCRTPQMGGRIEQCDSCGKKHLFYNSCRNRHCPSCQGHKREEWIKARNTELLPVTYYHVVFTIPGELNSLALHKPRELYSILFKTAWATLNQFGKTEGLQLGMISILHTWGQNLSVHPHLHCIVPGVGVDGSGNAKKAGKNKKFLYSVRALSKVFRAKFVAEMRSQKLGKQSLYNKLFSKKWVVYAKNPFGSPKSVIEYLGRYTHKIAISNYRIKAIDDTYVSFFYKDYKQGDKKKIMRLTHAEFVRRFAQHILPKRFIRIRHYGILSSTHKRKTLPDLQKNLGVKSLAKYQTKTLQGRCPTCKKGRLKVIMEFDSRGPPPLSLVGLKNMACPVN